jgi:hypothetical protein
MVRIAPVTPAANIRRPARISSGTAPHPVRRRETARPARRKTGSPSIARNKLTRSHRARSNQPRTCAKSRRRSAAESAMKRRRRTARKTARRPSMKSSAPARAASLRAHRQRYPQQQRNYGQTPHAEILLPCINGRTSHPIRALDSPSFRATHPSPSSTLRLPANPR